MLRFILLHFWTHLMTRLLTLLWLPVDFINLCVLSQVDAMADAIDRSYAVCYGVSLECERPIHPAAQRL